MLSWSLHSNCGDRQLNKIISSCVALGKVFNLSKPQFIVKTEMILLLLF